MFILDDVKIKNRIYNIIKQIHIIISNFNVKIK